MKPETKFGSQLQTLNRVAGITHLIQAIALCFILNAETRIPVITRFFAETSDGVRPITKTLFEFPIALIAPIFLLLSACAHLFISSPNYVRRYEQNIDKGINPLRWWEYAFSSSLMLVVLLMLGGLFELSTIVFIFTLNFIMNLMGLMMEKYNQLTDKTNWIAYIILSLVSKSALGWIIVLGTLGI